MDHIQCVVAALTLVTRRLQAAPVSDADLLSYERFLSEILRTSASIIANSAANTRLLTKFRSSLASKREDIDLICRFHASMQQESAVYDSDSVDYVEETQTNSRDVDDALRTPLGQIHQVPAHAPPAPLRSTGPMRLLNASTQKPHDIFVAQTPSPPPQDAGPSFCGRLSFKPPPEQDVDNDLVEPSPSKRNTGILKRRLLEQDSSETPSPKRVRLDDKATVIGISPAPETAGKSAFSQDTETGTPSVAAQLDSQQPLF